MTKTQRSVAMNKREDRTKPPKSVQDIIPIKKIWPDGIALVGKNRYAKTYQFTDINYAVASREDKEIMFLGYSDVINSFEAGATVKISVVNRKLGENELEEKVLLQNRDDQYYRFRTEINTMLLEKAESSNAIVQDKYVTVTTTKKSVEEARQYFSRIGADLIGHFNRLGSQCRELKAPDKLKIFHDFFRPGEETSFHLDLKSSKKKGHDFKDYICPDSVELKNDHFIMGNQYARVIYLKEYASYIKDSMLSELCEISSNLILSIDITTVPTDEAIRIVQNLLLGVEKNITDWQRRQNANNNYTASIPYDLEQQQKELREILDDLTTRDQRLMFADVVMTHTADTFAKLKADTDALLTTGRRNLCQFAPLKFQQLDGLQTALPFGGYSRLHTQRTLTTESLSVLMPFRVQEIMHGKGIYQGDNAISKNPIMVDRYELQNGNQFVLGLSGSGKSMFVKSQLAHIALQTDADIFVIDPESEFRPVVHAFGGEVVNISATSPHHINALEINKEYGVEDGADPVILKSEYIMSLIEQLMDNKQLGAKQKSIIDRCADITYSEYKRNDYTGKVPTLQDFYFTLLAQPEPEARDLGLALELFTTGSLNTFAQESNVNTNSRIVCYDIRGLGEQLLPVGMLVVLDSIFNRITANRQKKRSTYVFIDEFYLFLAHSYSASFFHKLWKRVRKYNAFCVAATQNVSEVLKNDVAKTMLSNSEFVVMLNQSSSDRDELADLYSISSTQLNHISNVDAGRGLMKIGPSLIPFVNEIPRHTELYRLMTTKPSESMI